MALPRPAKAPRRPRDQDAATSAPGAPAPATPFHPTAAHRAVPETPSDLGPPKRPARHTLLRVALYGVLAYGLGWYVSFNGVLPGVFLASDIGLPAVLFATLRGVARITRTGARHPAIAKSGAGLATASGWAITLYWFFATLTNVFQLAIGLALGIIGYAAYTARTRMAKAGFPGFGPAFTPMMSAVALYIGWQLVRVPLGPLPGFDAMSAAGVFLASIAILRSTTQRVQDADRLVPDVAAQSKAFGGSGQAEKRVLAGVIIGYLFFRIFISSVIPYGPVVEWFLVCTGVLFFAIVAAERIGTVPTRRSLPDPEERTHVQRVSSLPDQQLAEAEARMSAFIDKGQDLRWIRQHLHDLLHASGYPPREIDERLQPFTKPQSGSRHNHAPLETAGPTTRQEAVADILHQVRTRRVPTGTLKADPTVQRDGPPRPTPGA